MSPGREVIMILSIYGVHGGHLGFQSLNIDRFLGAWDFFYLYAYTFPQKKFYTFVTHVTILQNLVAKPLDYSQNLSKI